ncbi:NAD(P)H-hydrate dehydratase [Lachnospiraceae bacterium ZAX-1]
MEILVNSSEMKHCDQHTIKYYGVPSLVLMERAALCVIEEIENHNLDTGRCLVVCGIGNNGGDGLAVARMLFLKGCKVDIVIKMNEEKASIETKQQFQIARQYQIPMMEDVDLETMQGSPYTLVVDSLFGIGLTRDVAGRDRTVINKMNKISAYKLAVDIPSGISADTGEVMGTAFLADLTVTFAYKKLGMVLYPGAEYSGLIKVKDIGVADAGWHTKQPSVLSFEPKDLKRYLPVRPNRSNKGTFGKVLIVAGSIGMSGAAFLSGKAAYATGCGLVNLFTDKENQTILQTLLPEAIVTTWNDGMKEQEVADALKEAMATADVIVAGPGLKTDTKAVAMIETIAAYALVPVIFDADGLNILAKQEQIGSKLPPDTILTPHLGEMSRLCKTDISYIQAHLLQTAQEFARSHHAICVLKDARTICAIPDEKLYVNQSGNAGMATAGAGDVLTGVIAGLVAQGVKPKIAAPFGVYIHGLAGNYMLQKTGPYGLMAQDIIAGILQVMREEPV